MKIKPATERKLLQACIVPAIAQSSSSVGRILTLYAGVGVVIGVVVLFLVIFKFSDSIGLFGTVAISTAIGWFLGFVTYWKSNAKYWICIQPHISTESVAARLSQLE